MSVETKQLDHRILSKICLNVLKPTCDGGKTPGFSSSIAEEEKVRRLEQEIDEIVMEKIKMGM